MIRFILACSILFHFSLIHGQSNYEVLVLGTSQDGGYPQYNCSKSCCMPVWQKEVSPSYVSSLAIIDKETRSVWLIDCTPDFKDQMFLVHDYFKNETFYLQGIFLTHAHIGHYAGLIDLGREVSNSKEIPLYVMPRMRQFIENNGPWDQLVNLDNIVLHDLKNESSIEIAEDLSITPFLVPHRDEYSETVGFSICGNDEVLVYIPDIDKWEKWEKDIEEVVSNSTYTLLDGTFYSSDELRKRNMEDIPHPSVKETMAIFKKESSRIKRKIYFTHLNHSNPLHRKSQAYDDVVNNNFNVAKQGSVFLLKHSELNKEGNTLLKQ